MREEANARIGELWIVDGFEKQLELGPV